jgi:hypothetical protein
MKKHKKKETPTSAATAANKILTQADDLLAKIAETKGLFKFETGEMGKEVEAIKEKYGSQFDYLQRILKSQETDLIVLMKDNKVRIFDDRDQVDLEHGILLYGKEDKVSIPRDALAKIKAQGWKEAIKVAESVDRAVVETWPIERLVLIGAEKKPVEVFDYEIRSQKEERDEDCNTD